MSIVAVLVCSAVVGVSESTVSVPSRTIDAVFLPQRLDPPARPTYPDDEVKVRAIDQAGQPVAGLRVNVVSPKGSKYAWTTDGNGVARFTPTMPGGFELGAKFPSGVEVLAIHQVATRPKRWLWALLVTPPALLLLVWNLRRWRNPTGAS